MTRETKRKIVFDVILVAVLLAVALSAFLIYSLTVKDGEGQPPTGESYDGMVVVVRLGSDIIAEYPLSLDGEYTLCGGTNRITVKDGAVRMSYSTCKGYQDCVEYGWLYPDDTSMIVCAPNRIMVTIEEK